MKHLFTLLSFLLCSTLAFAQGTVSGNISDDEGAPLPGATIVEVGTNNGVSTEVMTNNKPLSFVTNSRKTHKLNRSKAI